MAVASLLSLLLLGERFSTVGVVVYVTGLLSLRLLGKRFGTVGVVVDVPGLLSLSLLGERFGTVGVMLGVGVAGLLALSLLGERFGTQECAGQPISRRARAHATLVVWIFSVKSLSHALAMLS